MPAVSEGTGQTERDEMRQRELLWGRAKAALHRNGEGRGV